MAEEDSRDGQRTIRQSDMPYFPATVDDHTERSDGLTLHTINPDPDSDIEVYNDDRPAHRSGEEPEAE